LIKEQNKENFRVDPFFNSILDLFDFILEFLVLEVEKSLTRKTGEHHASSNGTMRHFGANKVKLL
jgi:hypothetical protein